MRLRTLTLHHFRNVGFARIEFSGHRHFFVGANGQGKTNLLEAAGFITALRSFRTSDSKLLRGHLQPVAAITCDVDHERLGDSHVAIKLHREGRELWCDKVRVTRLADHLGKYPTVVFSSQDLQLVRGSPAGRRRWLDLTMAAMDPAYLNGLQTYTRALAERNALLKRGMAADAELAAFEQTLAPPAAALISMRTAGLRSLGGLFRAAYGKLCDGAEEAELVYAPNFADADPEVLLARLESWRARDKQFRTTLAGPHRDDVDFRVGGQLAKDFSSEGQQRSLVLALRLAQAAWFQARCGVRPVLLADDVLGELDPDRRRRFWAAMDQESQVLATGTAPPDAELGKWQMFSVACGVFDEVPVPVEEAS